MSAKSLILSAAAYESLAAIGEWTREQFGSRQASRYEDKLIAHCQRIADGTAPSLKLPRHLRPRGA